jgi:hypothetical protein
METQSAIENPDGGYKDTSKSKEKVNPELYVI